MVFWVFLGRPSVIWCKLFWFWKRQILLPSNPCMSPPLKTNVHCFLIIYKHKTNWINLLSIVNSICTWTELLQASCMYFLQLVNTVLLEGSHLCRDHRGSLFHLSLLNQILSSSHCLTQTTHLTPTCIFRFLCHNPCKSPHLAGRCWITKD